MSCVMIVLEMEKSCSCFNVSIIKTTHKYMPTPPTLETWRNQLIFSEFEPDVNPLSWRGQRTSETWLLFISRQGKISLWTLNSYRGWKFWQRCCTARQCRNSFRDLTQHSGQHSNKHHRDAFNHSRTNESLTSTLNSLIQIRQLLIIFCSTRVNLSYSTSCLKQRLCNLVHVPCTRLWGRELFEQAGKLQWQR